MIIDLKDKFLDLRKETEENRREKTHQEYLLKYLNLRDEWRSEAENICNVFLDKYEVDEDDEYYEDDWSSLILLCNDVYDYSAMIDELNLLKEYVKDKATLYNDEIDLSLKENMDEKYHEYIPILIRIEKIMHLIVDLRDEFVEKIKDNSFIFKSKFDQLTLNDYMRISLLEDLILEQGAFIDIEEDL